MKWDDDGIVVSVAWSTKHHYARHDCIVLRRTYACLDDAAAVLRIGFISRLTVTLDDGAAQWSWHWTRRRSRKSQRSEAS